MDNLKSKMKGNSLDPHHQQHDSSQEEEEDSSQEEVIQQFYLHIDIKGQSEHIGPKVNSYMLRHDAYDPRRLAGFPSDLLDQPSSLNDIRELQVVQNSDGVNIPMSKSYYELWTVRGNFDLEAMEYHFRKYRNALPFEIKLLAIIDNEHLPHTWRYAPKE